MRGERILKVTFLGAAQTVTGSCYYFEFEDKKFLIDCGMFQGGHAEDELNFEVFPFNPSEVDFMILSHAHIDHSGRIPKLYKDGFRGIIYATDATVDLCSIMLPDSAHIQESDVEWKNKKRKREGKEELKPLYTIDDAYACLELFQGVKYGQVIEISSNLRFILKDAGHMLGSAIVELYITEDGKEYKLVFSGDLGNRNVPILKDPSTIDGCDYLFIESTYGDRLHEDVENKSKRLIKIIYDTISNGGKVIIPSFAVGRTQEILYEIAKELTTGSDEAKLIQSIEIFVDSPLATSASGVYKKHIDYFDEEAAEFIKKGIYLLEPKNLKFVRTADESRMLNNYEKSCIIISSSGMCEAGRIKHHLKHNLWKENNTILFVGYQAPNTLGRKLLDGQKKVKIFGEEIEVKAKIEYIEAYSGHADKNGLIKWIDNMKNKPKRVFVVHGEKESQIEFAQEVKRNFGVEVHIPARGEFYVIGPEQIVTKDRLFSESPSFINLSILAQIEDIEDDLNRLKELIKSASVSPERLNAINNNLEELRYLISLALSNY